MFWSKVNKLCEEKGLSVSEMCRRLGLSASIASDWKQKGASPRASTKKKIADFFKVDISYFNEPTFEVKSRTELRALRIPVLGRVPAGIPLEAIEDIIDFEEIPADMVRGGSEYFGLRVSGDSMYPKYLEGDIIIVRRQDTCENGQDCVVYVNGYDATLKTVYLLDNGGIRLQPVNPQYAPKSYFVGDEPVSIAGVVVELRRKII